MIPDIAPQGKQLLDKLFVPTVIVLVGVAAFGLGRLSVLEQEREGLVIHPALLQND